MNWAALPLVNDETALDPLIIGPKDCATPVEFDNSLCRLISPDDGTSLKYQNGRFVSQSSEEFPILHTRPVLLPRRAIEHIKDGSIELSVKDTSDAFLQYLYLGAVKGGGGEANLLSTDVWYRRHLHRSKDLVSDVCGLVVDVGCDDPKLSRSLFPATAQYIGLDPVFGERSEPSLVAMAEFLPFANASVDAVAFLTSLDHILDYHTAIEEAFRILRPGGTLYLATLIWTSGAELTRDNIHFHHFRDFEIDGVLRPFDVRSVKRYAWKGDTHRTGAYIRATKPAATAL